MSAAVTFPIIFPVACHTSSLGLGSTFVVIKGHKQDGVQYIEKALQKGARIIVIEQDVVLSLELEQAIVDAGACVVRVANTRKALAELSAQALNYPAKKLKLIGITGTKGKTSTAFITEHILKKAGHKTALLSTVKNSIAGHDFPTNLTTQQPDYLHVFFKLCLDAGVEYVVMEVAAQALSLHRVDGLKFDAVAFTNFEPEHAEFYSTVDDYFKAKCFLFDHVKPGAPIVINADDVWAQKISAIRKDVQQLSLKKRDVDFYAQIKEHASSLTFDVTARENLFTCNVPSLVGEFNAYNCLASCALAFNLGVKTFVIADAFVSFDHIPGRMQCHLLPNGARCYIDYAHTPSSYKNVLSVLRAQTNHLIVVFGAGGERDATKRPLMGAIASEYADIVIVTSDNPRSENPQAIADQIIAGVQREQRYKVMCELNREGAIKKAYELATPGSIIVLLGKGPDEYQIVGEHKSHFSEAGILQSLQ